MLAACVSVPYLSPCNKPFSALLPMVPQAVRCVDSLPPIIGEIIKVIIEHREQIDVCLAGNHTAIPTASPTHPSTHTLAPTVDPGPFRLLVCIIEAIDPALTPIIKIIELLIEWWDVIVVLFDLLKQFPQLGDFLLQTLLTGQVRIPGSVVLVYFQWAKVVPNNSSCGDTDCTYSIVADTQWYYCLFAIGMFLLGVEIFKLLALRYVNWIKR